MPKEKKYAHLIPEWKVLYEKGESFAQIGKTYHVAAKTVNRNLSPYVEIRRRDKWYAYADEWYDLYANQGYTKTEIAQQYKTNPSQVMKVLASKGIQPETRGKLKYEHWVKEWIRLYESGESLQSIADRYGLRPQTVLNYLKREGVETRDLSEAVRTLALNETYFDSLNKDSAYHLGLMFATGSLLHTHNSYIAQISAGQEKRYLIQPLIDVLKGEEKGVYQGTDGVYRVRFSSKHLYGTLKKYGLDERRFLTFPSLPDEWIPPFILGYLNGTSYIHPAKHYLSVSGSHLFLQELKKQWDSQLPDVEFGKIKIKEIKKETEYRLNIYEKSTVQKLKKWLCLQTDVEKIENEVLKTWILNREEFQ